MIHFIVEVINNIIYIIGVRAIINWIFRKIPQQSKKDNSVVTENVHIIDEYIENGITYWFGKMNGEFIAQGNNDEELIGFVKSKYENEVFYLETRDMFLSKVTNWTFMSK